jgi:hypothetical protein
MIRSAAKLAGKLLGPKMHMRLGGRIGVKQLLGDALASGGASAGFTAAGQLMSGEGLDIPEILAYGVADTVTGGLAAGGVRALRGTKGLRKGKVKGKDGKMVEAVLEPREVVRSRGEVPANVIASILTPMGVSAALNKQPQQPQKSAQTEQVDQQQIQRMLLNEGLLAGQYMPGTMFQGMGVQPPQTLMQQYLNDQGPTIEMDPKAMASIVGL